MITSLPNLLTMSRIAILPLLLGLLFIEGDIWKWLACALFVLAAVTDFLDGYLARSWAQQSAFGRFLDPIADKILVAATLMSLVAVRQIDGWAIVPALIILCREILVSGLREFLASLRVGLPVSRLAKWKTGIQMTAIGVLIVGASGPAFLPVTLIGEIGLWTAAALTLATGYDYLRASVSHVRPDTESTPSADPGSPLERSAAAGDRPR